MDQLDFIKDIVDSLIETMGYTGVFWGAFLTVVILLIAILIYIAVGVSLIKANRKLFKRVRNKKGNSVSYQFIERVIEIGLIVLLFVIPLGGDRIAQSLLGSTAVIAAIVGLAANDVIKDTFAGLQISIYKPFDVGSRVEFDNGMVGIVEQLTLRHIVLAGLDSTRYIIPNSKANTMTLVNYSYGNVPRSLALKFPIAYSSDINKAKQVMTDTICDCTLTLNEKKTDEKNPNSRSVYFLELNDSALIMGATVLYPSNIRTEVVKDEINTLVFNAFKENGIEVPYNYLNVVVQDANA